MVHRNIQYGNDQNTTPPLEPKYLKAWSYFGLIQAAWGAVGCVAIGKRMFCTASHVSTGIGKILYAGQEYNIVKKEDIDYVLNGIHYGDASIIFVDRDIPYFAPCYTGSTMPDNDTCFTVTVGNGRGTEIFNNNNVLIGYNASENWGKRWAIGHINNMADSHLFSVRYEGDPNGSEGFSVALGDSGSPVFVFCAGNPYYLGPWISKDGYDNKVFFGENSNGFWIADVINQKYPSQTIGQPPQPTNTKDSPPLPVAHEIVKDNVTKKSVTLKISGVSGYTGKDIMFTIEVD